MLIWFLSLSEICLQINLLFKHKINTLLLYCYLFKEILKIFKFKKCNQIFLCFFWTPSVNSTITSKAYMLYNNREISFHYFLVSLFVLSTYVYPNLVIYFTNLAFIKYNIITIRFPLNITFLEYLSIYNLLKAFL